MLGEVISADVQSISAFHFRRFSYVSQKSPDEGDTVQTNLCYEANSRKQP